MFIQHHDLRMQKLYAFFWVSLRSSCCFFLLGLFMFETLPGASKGINGCNIKKMVNEWMWLQNLWITCESLRFVGVTVLPMFRGSDCFVCFCHRKPLNFLEPIWYGHGTKYNITNRKKSEYIPSGIRKKQKVSIFKKKNITGWCLTPTLLLICSSFSRENCHLLLICSSLSTAQIKMFHCVNLPPCNYDIMV